MRWYAPILIPLVLVIVTPAGLAKDPKNPAVSGQRAKELITYLASDALQGRKSGTAGFRQAADWAAEHFASWGLEPAGEDGTYFQKVDLPDYTWSTGVPSLSVAGREFSYDDEDFALLGLATAGTRVNAEVVFAGYGISAPEKGLDEYAGLDVTGKVVLILKGSPTKAPAARQFFSRSAPAEEKEAEKDPWADEAKDQSKIQTAYDKGAAAVLLYDPETDAESDPYARWRRRRAATGGWKPERDFLAFTIEERVVRAIMKRDPQESTSGFTRRLDAMRRAIKEKKPQSGPTGVKTDLAGYTTRARHCAENENNWARNVIAKIPGTDPRLAQQYVIVGGHLDHVGMSDGYIRNGADDNASGAATTMEVARAIAESGFKPKRTLIFCCWCGEELGLLGSMHYTRTPSDGVSMDRVVTYFNLDMVGLGDNVNAPGALNFPEIWQVICRDQDPEIMKAINPSEGGPGGSDHSGFIEKGIEAMALMTGGGGGHPDYHQPEDDAAKIDPEILRKTGQFVAQGMLNLANETETDLIIENRETIYRALRTTIANINPDLEGSRWMKTDLGAKTKAELTAKMLEEARRLATQPAETSSSSSRSPFGGRSNSSRTGRSASNGLGDLRPFEGDMELFDVVCDVHRIGRVDLSGDDGFWIDKGRLTDKGREWLGRLEKGKVLVHLISPAEALLEDFVDAASKPFLVTGDYVVPESLADRIVEKKILLGVDLDPSHIAAFIARLEELKNRLGNRDLLTAYLTSTSGLQEARRPLYFGLLEKGWAPQEISGSRRRPGGVLGGNLGALGVSTGGRRRR